jgi:hypothetical protein
LVAGGALALARHPLSTSTAFAQLNSQIQAARSLAAASGDGATLAIVPAGQGGFRSRLYGGRPDRALWLASAPVVESQAAISEESAGSPPFTIFISSAGDFSVAPGGPMAVPAEPPCPPSGGVHITLADPSAGRRTVDLPCRSPASGPPLPVAANSPAP